MVSNTAPECCKHAVRQVCVDLGVSCISTEACAGLEGPDPNPDLAQQGKFVPVRASQHRRWERVELRWGEFSAGEWWNERQIGLGRENGGMRGKLDLGGRIGSGMQATF